MGKKTWVGGASSLCLYLLLNILRLNCFERPCVSPFFCLEKASEVNREAANKEKTREGKKMSEKPKWPNKDHKWEKGKTKEMGNFLNGWKINLFLLRFWKTKILIPFMNLIVVSLAYVITTIDTACFNFMGQDMHTQVLQW